MKYLKDSAWSFWGAVICIFITFLVNNILNGNSVPKESEFMVVVVLAIFTLPAAITFALLNGLNAARSGASSPYIYSASTCILAVSLYVFFIGIYGVVLSILTIGLSLIFTSRELAKSV